MVERYPSPFSIGGSSAPDGKAFGSASIRIFLSLVTTVVGAMSHFGRDRDNGDRDSIYSCSVLYWRDSSTLGPPLCYIESTP